MATIPISSIRAMFALLAQTADLPVGSALWHDRFCRSTADLFRAHQAVLMRGTSAGAGLEVEVLWSGWQTPEEQRIFQRDVRERLYRANPLLRVVPEGGGPDPTRALRRTDRIDSRHWYASEYVQETFRTLDVDDVMLCLRPLATGGWAGLALLRPWKDPRRFSVGDALAAQLLFDAAAGGLKLERDDAPLLPSRLRQVHDLLLRGLSEKQIAGALGLSPHTVHHHVERLYRRLNINGRTELFTRR